MEKETYEIEFKVSGLSKEKYDELMELAKSFKGVGEIKTSTMSASKDKTAILKLAEKAKEYASSKITGGSFNWIYVSEAKRQAFIAGAEYSLLTLKGEGAHHQFNDDEISSMANEFLPNLIELSEYKEKEIDTFKHIWWQGATVMQNKLTDSKIEFLNWTNNLNECDYYPVYNKESNSLNHWENRNDPTDKITSYELYHTKYQAFIANKNTPTAFIWNRTK